MNFCELGGHKQGLKAAAIAAEDLKIFNGSGPPRVRDDQNYMTAWGFDADATQFGVRAAADSKTYHLSAKVCEPQLVVHHFDYGDGCRLILGNLHIRIPNEQTVHTKVRQTQVFEALQKLEIEVRYYNGTQPVVQVLVGDCNLT